MTAPRFGLGGLAGQAPDGTRDGFNRSLKDLVATAQLAEASGFDGVWVSEHHFVEDGYLPAPLIALTAIAQATSSVRIGTQVLLAPLHDPIRLAEDAAVLDQLSDGRLVLGLGLGYQGREYAAFRVPEGGRVTALRRCVDTLRTAWSGEPIALADDLEVKVRPLPHQDGGPRILIGAIAEAAVRRAAHIGDGFVAPMMGIRGFARRLEWLDEEKAPESFSRGIYIHAFVAPHDAWETARAGVRYVEQQYQRWQSAHKDFDQFKTVDRGDVTDAPDHVIVGTPAEVAEKLAPWCGLLDDGTSVAPDIIVRLTYPGIDAHAARESVRLFGTEVIPQLAEQTASA